MKKFTSQLVMGLALSFTSVIVNSTMTNQLVLAKPTNLHKCDIFAYVTDTDPQGINVRKAAGTRNRIVGKIPINETVKIIAIAGNWVQITNASDGFQGTGWVFVKNLGISTKGYATNGVDIYTNANLQSRKIIRVPASLNIKLLGCKGDWAKVEYKGLKGWLAKEDQCGAALTSCS
ncbi:MAG: SH3 domain-containing protein [Desmonostoc vinosum HA7617-LM4]|jgi:SH3-like domain-containing protein|nr:SH3 domain-containing protein [Desmonostoc vinosum HA7617-LM4]